MSSTDALDNFILDAVDSSWQKVAMVVAKAITDQGLEFPKSEDDAEFVASRIRLLVQAGHLEAAGDVSNWRFSEIRRAAISAGAA
ncbi:MAG: hypothetical protein EON85_10275 [Brevundimonas sp.]|nr:MAG: hypothetical protein EON85_10275 [Brevundimonas sp.]